MTESIEPSEKGPHTPDLAGLEAMDRSLEEIERTLHQMLLLAELSASNINTDREQLQAVLERLKDKINRIADLL